MVAPKLDLALVRRHFNSHAEEYDRYARVQARVVTRLAALLDAAELDGLCLEVGAGTGRLSATLQARAPGFRPLVSDLAHGMTWTAARRLQTRLAADAEAGRLPFRTGAFRAVLSASVYQWVDELAPAFTEAGRVLQPGGSFAFALFGERSLCELRSSHRRALRETGARRESHVQEFHTPAQVRKALDASGLEVEQFLSEQEIEFHPSVPDLLKGLKKIGAGNASTRRPPGLASRRVMQRMIALYEEGFGEARGIPATYQVIYGVARKRTQTICSTAHLR